MATVQRIFDTLDTSSFLDGGSAASVTDAGQLSEPIDISQWEGVHCFADVDFPNSPTDDLVIEVLASNDGQNYDTIPLFTFTVDNANGADTVSWIVTSVYAFKVNFKASGSTDSINIFFRYRRWRWETA
ncbi:MAG: hypothetical protein ACXAC5_02565 [Promethearchaeota archaeon]|jgi:hypothetical protein